VDLNLEEEGRIRVLVEGGIDIRSADSTAKGWWRR
jgi:hypothetical protein